MWTCDSCGSLNGDEKFACEVCGRPGSAGATTATGRPGDDRAGDDRPARSGAAPDVAVFGVTPTRPETADAPVESFAVVDPLAPVEPVGPVESVIGADPAGPGGSIAPPDPDIRADPEPGEGRTRRLRLVVAAAVLVLAGSSVGVAVLVLRKGSETGRPAAGRPAVTQPAVTAEDTAASLGQSPDLFSTPDPVSGSFSTGPAVAGLVTVAPAVTDDRVADVAATLDTYFRGVNAHDRALLAGVLDPSGVVDPGDDRQMSALMAAIRTTRDTDIVLSSVTGSGPLVQARVSFRSHQDPGYGPRADPQQTCTRWDLTYTLKQAPSGYRVVRSSGRPRGC